MYYMNKPCNQWFKKIDWSAIPLTNYQNSILQQIKEAENDEKLIKIISKVFTFGYNQATIDRIYN